MNKSKMVKHLIEFWKNDPKLPVGVPCRRMATQAVDYIISHLSEDPEVVQAGMSDELEAMEGSIAETMGSLGIEAVEFADDDGNVSHIIDCKPKLKFHAGESDD